MLLQPSRRSQPLQCVAQQHRQSHLPESHPTVDSTTTAIQRPESASIAPETSSASPLEPCQVSLSAHAPHRCHPSLHLMRALRANSSETVQVIRVTTLQSDSGLRYNETTCTVNDVATRRFRGCLRGRPFPSIHHHARPVATRQPQWPDRFLRLAALRQMHALTATSTRNIQWSQTCRWRTLGDAPGAVRPLPVARAEVGCVGATTGCGDGSMGRGAAVTPTRGGAARTAPDWPESTSHARCCRFAV